MNSDSQSLFQQLPKEILKHLIAFLRPPPSQSVSPSTVVNPDLKDLISLRSVNQFFRWAVTEEIMEVLLERLQSSITLKASAQKQSEESILNKATEQLSILFHNFGHKKNIRDRLRQQTPENLAMLMPICSLNVELCLACKLRDELIYHYKREQRAYSNCHWHNSPKSNVMSRMQAPLFFNNMYGISRS